MENTNEGICVNNLEVLCDKRNCENCGWNAKVSEERMKHIVFMVCRRKVKK